VRALFDWDMSGSTPDRLSLNVDDVLKVTDVSDADWWRAENIVTNKTGLIPSRAQYEAHAKLSDAERERMDEHHISTYHVVTMRHVSNDFGSHKIARPLFIHGPEKIQFTDALELALPNIAFVHVVPHTTRAKQEGEVDGEDFHFVSTKEMEDGIANKMFIEAAKYKVRLVIVLCLLLDCNRVLLSLIDNLLNQCRETTTEHRFRVFGNQPWQARSSSWSHS
jgi:hypothetical protein